MSKEELEKAAYEEYKRLGLRGSSSFGEFSKGYIAGWQASHAPAVSVEAGNTAEAWAQKRLGHFSLYDSLPISSVEDVAEEAYLAGFQARSHLVELLREAEGVIRLHLDGYSEFCDTITKALGEEK